MEDRFRKVAVIGAGVSGLGAARLLGDRYRVTVYEKADRPGGLIRCRNVAGSLFHLCGGHIFNSRRQEVLDWFWTLFNRTSSFTKADRNSSIVLPDGSFVGYPIEDHIYQLPEEVQRGCIRDFAARLTQDNAVVAGESFERFLRRMFGETLYALYFRPYNEKIWRQPLSGVSVDWLDGKLPMPSAEEVFLHNFTRREEGTFVHRTFWYPKSGGSQYLADTLAQGLDIRYNAGVGRIRRQDGKWLVQEEVYDLVIYTGNVRELPQSVKGIDLSGFEHPLSDLSFHGTTSVFCEIDPVPYTWVYLPSQEYDAHRIICTGNFSAGNNAPGKHTATVEFTGFAERKDIEEQLLRMPLHPRFLDSQYTPCSYPVQHRQTRELIRSLKKTLQPYGFYLTGRFADWEYYNMDAALGAAMDLSALL